MVVAWLRLVTMARARALLAARARREGSADAEPRRPVRRFVGMVWSAVVLLLLGLMPVPLAVGAIDAILHP
jgi:hypothetical protein